MHSFRHLLPLCLAAVILPLAPLGARPVDLSIPEGGLGPTTAEGDALHWVELPEYDFGGGLRLPLRLSFESDRVKGPREFGAKSLGWRSPALHAQIVLRNQERMAVMLPCGKLMQLRGVKDAPGSYATADGEWQGRVQGKITLLSREDGWELEYDAQGRLTRLRTDAGRTLRWNRSPIGQLLTVTEGDKVGLQVSRDAQTLTIRSIAVRTAAGDLEPQVFSYTAEQLTGILSPDGRMESYAYGQDAAGNPQLTITGSDLVKKTLAWHPQTYRLLSDGLWTYQIEDNYETSFPRFTRTGPNGELESFLDDSTKSGIVAHTSADGTITQREKITAAGPARGQLRRVTRQLAGAKEAVTLYQAEHDARGLLVVEMDALGRKTTHAYELHGITLQSGIKRKVSTNPLGAKLSQEFDAHGNLVAMTDPLGHTARHEYDGQGRRVKTTGPDGVVVEALVYDDQGRLAARTDALGATTKHGYDARGNRSTTTDALGNVTKHEFNQRGLRIATTDALGNTTRFEYDAGGRLTATVLPAVDSEPKPVGSALQASRHAYDPQGRRIRTTAADGSVTEATTYDAFGRITSRTDALGHVTRFEYSVKHGCATCSAAGQPTRIISPDGRVTERVYDVGRHLIAETLAAGTPDAATTQYSYDLAGNRLSSTDPLGRVTRFEYDAANRRTAVIHPDKTTRTFAYNANGQVITETDELGHTTKRAYDAYGNVIATTDAAGNTMRTLFEKVGSEQKAAVSPKTGAATDNRPPSTAYAALHRPTGTVSAAGVRTQIDYDLLGRRVAVTKAPGTSLESTTRHEYDAVGNEIATTNNIGAESSPAAAPPGSQPHASGQSGPALSPAPSALRTVHTYDSRKRRVTTTDALNRTWRFVYNDAAGPSGPAPCCGADPTSNTRAAEVIHPDGSREQKTYNAKGQLIATTDAKGDTVKYAYDAAGRLSELTDANGHSTKWRYDARGKLAAKTYPDNTTELYEHDAAGQMTSRVRPDGTSARYAYDPRGRLLSIEWSDGKTENSTFAYDAAGHLTLAKNTSATIQRTYNDSGRMAQETQIITALAQSSPVAAQLEQPFTAEVGYQYDEDGRLAQLTYPDQTTVSYRYNERGELREVQDSMPHAPGSKPGAATYTRRADGKITQLALPNGTVTTKTYDEVGRLAEIKHADPAGNTLFSETSRYDLKNRRTARVQADGSADLFAYDPAGQVTAAAYGQAIANLPATTKNEEPGTKNIAFEAQQTFAYDPAGNRLAATDGDTKTEYRSNAANQYTAVATGTQIVEPQFDKLGNLLHDDKNTYTWDADIHLLSVVTQSSIKDQASSATRFSYDALHRRVARHESGTNTTTFFVIDGWNVISEFESRNFKPTTSKLKLSAKHVWGEDLSGTLQGAGGIGGLLSSVHQPSTTVNNGKPPSTVPMWFHYDSNGNVIRLTNALGKESARYSYDAFGKTIFSQGPAAEGNGYRFSTKPVDAGSGLAYYGYRYYSPELGRWPSRDPIYERGGYNLYEFAANSGLNKSDYLGLALPLAIPAGILVWEGICSVAAATAAALTTTEAAAAVVTIYVVTQASSSSCQSRCEVRAITQENVSAPRRCPKIGTMISGAGYMCIYKCEGRQQFMEPEPTGGCESDALEPDWVGPDSN